jgi:hypothetical protein
MRTDTPYKMAIDGQANQDRSFICCKEFGYKTENAAFDLEQLFTVAMFDMAQNRKASSDNAKVEKDDFFNKDCPTDKEIQERAMGLEMMIKSSAKVKISQLLEIFSEFLDAGLIQVEGGQVMTEIIWQSVKPSDKLKILFWYCAFFVNPLRRLETMSI